MQLSPSHHKQDSSQPTIITSSPTTSTNEHEPDTFSTSNANASICHHCSGTGSLPSSPPIELPVPHRGYSLAIPGETPPNHALGHATSYETMRRERHGVARGASPAPSNASQASPLDFHDLVQIYQIVSNRRATFDSLLWSVPSTSFAAQAFLFQTALAGDTAQSSRIISMSLSILITVLTLQLFTRQLQAESADHEWLEDWERRHKVDPSDCAHGPTWNTYRSKLPHRARHFKILARIRGFTLWSNGMLVIGMVALGVLVTTAIKPVVFVNCNGNGPNS